MQHLVPANESTVVSVDCSEAALEIFIAEWASMAQEIVQVQPGKGRSGSALWREGRIVGLTIAI